MKELTLLEQMILAVITALDGGAFGVSIRKKVEILTGRRLMYGTLYKALGQLLRKGYVTKTEGSIPSVRGGRPRIYYDLTDSGQKALEASFKLQQAIRKMVPGFIID
jgi:PadR family transcriptional regulator PadR